MKVRATEKGYDGLQIRNKGDVFDIKDRSFDSHWMEQIGPAPKPETPAAAPEPVVPAAPKGGKKLKKV